jgi:hypothetical protein
MARLRPSHPPRPSAPTAYLCSPCPPPPQTGDGGLRQWQICNRIMHDAHVPNSFFALRVDSQGDSTATVLQVRSKFKTRPPAARSAPSSFLFFSSCPWEWQALFAPLFNPNPLAPLLHAHFASFSFYSVVGKLRPIRLYTGAHGHGSHRSPRQRPGTSLAFVAPHVFDVRLPLHTRER